MFRTPKNGPYLQRKTAMEDSMLFARNLPRGTKKSDIIAFFSEFHITDATVKTKFATHRCYAFLTFENPDYCKQALETHTQFTFKGSKCSLQQFLPQSEREQTEIKQTPLDYIPNDRVWPVTLLPTDSLRTTSGSTMWEAVLSLLPQSISSSKDFAVCFDIFRYLSILFNIRVFMPVSLINFAQLVRIKR